MTGAPGTRVLHGERLADWTTLGVGGPASLLLEVADVGGLASALRQAEAEASPVLVLGGGSNVVVADAGFPGTVVRTAIEAWQVEAESSATVVVSVGAGRDWSAFVGHCVAEGLSGVECLSGIPGLVGGAPVQNIGAYGQDVSSTVTAVMVWDRLQGRERRLSTAECGFSYRHSVFKRNERYVVTQVSFRLQRSALSQPLRYPELAERLGRRLGERAPLAETAAAVLALRRAKGMVLDDEDPDSRSAGSFFVNPVLDDAAVARLLAAAPGIPNWPASGGTKVPAAWLVERAGFPRGYRLGTAAISSKHALAITAGKGALAADVLALARRVRAGVSERFGVLLEPEPVLVGANL